MTLEPPEQTDLARNLGWSVIAQGCTVSLSFFGAVVLARLLTPADYGLVAAAAPVIGVGQHLKGFGFATVIVQARKIDKPQIDMLFWASLAVSVVLAGVIAALAPALARLLDDRRLASVLPIAALSIVAAALAAQPTAILLRNLRFRTVAIRNVVSVGIATIVSVVIAAWTGSYWALIVGMVLTPVINFSISAGVAGWWPGLPRRGGSVAAMVKFGMNVWSANLFNFASRNADNLIVAYATNPRELGIYDRAYRLLLYPIHQAVLPLGQVMIPTLSRSLDKPEHYARLYWRAIAGLLLVCQPGMVIATVFPKTVIGLLLGPAWLAGAAIFGWCGIAGMFQIFLITTQWLLTSQGRGRELMWVTLTTSAIALASFVLGVQWGSLGLIIAYVLGQGLICLPLTLWAVGRAGPVRYADFARRLTPHLVALGFALAIATFSRMTFGSPRWPMLIAVSLLAYASYATVLLIMAGSRELVKEALDRVIDSAGRRLHRA